MSVEAFAHGVNGRWVCTDCGNAVARQDEAWVCPLHPDNPTVQFVAHNLRPDPGPLDIHTFFGLSYVNYLVLPRAVLQSMPDTWQRQFTAMLGDLDDAFGHLDWPDYDVRALRRSLELISVHEPCGECDEGVITDADGEKVDCPHCGGTGENDDVVEHRYETPEEVGYRPDPIPHYDRGRTILMPAGNDEADAA